tara:strand:+ start:487 stop:819 length:333 start_codon:yes stop_codon:yes gene_type:complete
MPLHEGLHTAHSLLIGADIRDKITLIAAGKVVSGFSVLRLLALGADFCNAARAMMFALGCIQVNTKFYCQLNMTVADIRPSHFSTPVTCRATAVTLICAPRESPHRIQRE